MSHLKMRNLQKVEGKMNKKEIIKLPDESLRLWSCCRLLWMCCERGLELPNTQTWLLRSHRMEGEAAWDKCLKWEQILQPFLNVQCWNNEVQMIFFQVFFSSSIFQDPFLKKLQVLEIQIGIQFQKSTHIFRLILPKSQLLWHLLYEMLFHSFVQRFLHLYNTVFCMFL